MATSYIEQETWFSAPQGVCKTVDASESPNADFSSEEKIKESVAELSSRCWYMFGEGEIDSLFSTDGWFGSGGGQGCHTCYTFKTPEGIDTINASAMYGYLLQEDYEASPLIRRSTRGLLGDGMSDLLIQDEIGEEVVTVSMLQARNVDSFIDDFAGVLSDGDKRRIQSTLLEIFNAENNPNLKKANPYVLITPNTDDISRTSAHQIIDQLGISRDGENNALMIWVDIGSNTARIDYGGNLATHIDENKVSDVLQEFKGSTVGSALKVVTERIKQDLDLDYDNPPAFIIENPNSYLSYLSGPGSAPLISDLEPNRQYSITYMDSKNRDNFQTVITGAVTGAATGAAAGTVIPGVGNIAGGVAGLIVGVAGGVTAADRIDLARAKADDVTAYLFDENDPIVEKTIVVGNSDTLYRSCNS